MNYVLSKVKIPHIMITFLMVTYISVDGCSIPFKYFEKETSANTIQGPITDTTEEPSINTSQKSTENTIEEQSSDSTGQPATTNEVPTITENTIEEQSSDSPGQPATTNEVPTITENTIEEQSSDSTGQPATTNEVPTITENTIEEQSSDSTGQPATTNEVPTITENTIEEQSSDSTDQPATTNEVPTIDRNEEPSISTQDSKNCSFKHCHVFKNGNLVLFPGGKNVRGYQNGANICHYSNGTIFVPRTEEDNKIWLEFIKMLYDEDNSFKEASYPMDYEYSKTKAFYWLFDTDTDEVNNSDYMLKIDDPNDGQPFFDDLTFADYDSRGRSFIYFSHDNENVFGQLQIRDGSKEFLGFAVCSAR
ncbi:UNVERIFIED_CONTAM: hypothetical protein RMT77_014961 [Armadillidium vulgare]